MAQINFVINRRISAQLLTTAHGLCFAESQQTNKLTNSQLTLVFLFVFIRSRWGQNAFNIKGELLGYGLVDWFIALMSDWHRWMYLV